VLVKRLLSGSVFFVLNKVDDQVDGAMYEHIAWDHPIEKTNLHPAFRVAATTGENSTHIDLVLFCQGKKDLL